MMATVLRVGLNLLLAYLIAAIVTLLFVTVAQLLAPPDVGPGILEAVIFEMGVLSFGAPVVLFVLLFLDLALRGVSNQRRSAVAVSLAPGVIAAVLLFAYPQIAYVALWFVAVGLPFGLAMQLPPRKPDSRPATSS